MARGQANLWRRSTPLGSSSSHSSTGLEQGAEALDVADPLHRRGLRSNVPWKQLRLRVMPGWSELGGFHKRQGARVGGLGLSGIDHVGVALSCGLSGSSQFGTDLVPGGALFTCSTDGFKQLSLD